MTKTDKLLDCLRSVPSGMLLESQVTGSGLSKALNDLLVAGKVDLTAHPTVRDGAAPACAVVLKEPHD